MAQNHHSLKGLAALSAMALLTVACTLFRPYAREYPTHQEPQQEAPPAPYPPPPQRAPPARENHLSLATHSLVTQAHAQLAHGDLPGASSTLDRALRIEPSSPLLWIELGRLRLAENDSHQAEVCGRKALALAGGDHGVQAQSERLLADALRAQRRDSH